MRVQWACALNCCLRWQYPDDATAQLNTRHRCGSDSRFGCREFDESKLGLMIAIATKADIRYWPANGEKLS